MQTRHCGWSMITECAPKERGIGAEACDSKTLTTCQYKHGTGVSATFI